MGTMSSKKKSLIPSPTKDKNTPSPTKSKSSSPQRLSPAKSALLRKPEEKPGSDDFLRCDLCRHTIEDPKTLDCLHSYCRDCLMTYIFETYKEETDDRQIACPVCLQKTKAPAKGNTPEEWANLLPTNSFLKGYLEAKSLKDPRKQCDTCVRQNKTNVAKSWCRICHDALCESCIGFHNALKTTKRHTLVDLAKLREQTVEEIMSEPLCATHSGESMTKYCEKHRAVVCEKCVAADHKGCKVNLLKDALAKHKDETDDVTKALTEETKFAKAIYDDRKKADTAFDKNQAEALKSIESVRQKINEHLKECEKNMLEEFAKLHEQEKTALETDMKEAHRIHKSASKVKGLHENANIYGTESHVLEVLPEAAREGEYYGTKLTSLNSRLTDTLVTFRPDATLEKLMNGIKKLGDLKVSKTRPEVASTANVSMTSLRSMRSDSDPEDEANARSGRRSVRFEDKEKPKKSFASKKIDEEKVTTKKIPTSLTGTLNARVASDIQACWLTGICFHPNGTIIAVDRNNMKIKVFNKSLSLASETKLSHEPFGLTMVGVSEIAVTIPRENKIEIYGVDSKLTYRESIATSEGGYGICYSSETGFLIACACAATPSVKVISRVGEEKLDICPSDQYQMPMFFRPWYVKINASGGSMFVSDCHKSHVTCISGTVIKKYLYKSGSLHSPRGLHVTKNGNVLLCGFGSDNVQLIGQNGEFISDVLGRRDDVIGPQEVALNEANDMMALTFDPSNGNSDIVKLYKITL